MTKQQKIEKLQKDIAFWQDKLNRSRKQSLISIRALHLNHARNELAKLKQSWEKIWQNQFYTLLY